MQGSTPQPGSLIGDKYILTRLLGQGGMGAVFEAEHKLTHKRVAIKCVLANLSAQTEATIRLLREAQAAALIRHPNVVDVFDVGQDGSTLFLVMELLEGESLGALLARGGFRTHEIVPFLLAAMRGVAAAHDQGVIHRDVKPDNIFLARVADTPQPVVKVLDFGISKVASSSYAAMTRTGAAMGTPMYMSYEQLCGEKNIDARTDVYAFGVILYEVATGESPYRAESFAELAVKIATSEPIRPRQHHPEIPEALEGLIVRAMSKQRDQRPATLRAFVRELEPFSLASSFDAPPRAQTPLAAAPSTLEPRTVADEYRIKRNVVPALSLAATATVLIAGASWYALTETKLEHAVSAATEPVAIPTVAVAGAPSPEPVDSPPALDARGEDASKKPATDASSKGPTRKKSSLPTTPAQTPLGPAPNPPLTAASAPRSSAAQSPPAVSNPPVEQPPPANPRAPGPIAEDPMLAAARQAGDVAMQAFMAGNYVVAADGLDKAFRMFPLPTLGLWSARARLKLGKLVEAHERYREAALAPAAGAANAPVQQAAQKDAARELEQLAPRVPSVTLRIEGARPEEITLTHNGAPLRAATVGKPLAGNPGPHLFVGTRGTESYQSEIVLGEGERRILLFRFHGSEMNQAGQEPRGAPAHTSADSVLGSSRSRTEP